MKQLLQRKLKILVELAILAMTVAWTGQPVSSSHAAIANSPAGASAPVALDSPGEQGFARVAHEVTPALVNITGLWGARPRDAREFRDRMEDFFRFPRSPHGPMDPWLEPREPRGGGMGSGVIVSPDGHIVTNNHVVQGASELTVILPDKREFEAKVIGTDPKTDLAVIKVDARDLPYVRWGDSSTVQVGDYVLAIGNPFGLNST
ncbi:MAG: trypsin-like peptidase domain-containing protein, partial [Nitrospirae bacterium]|nr:trypsin-like peptidase domain-containing protein [Nitrospirota bacterium]